MMGIIANKQRLNQAFWLYFHLFGVGDEWIDYNLPTPTYHKHIDQGYLLGWAIDGYFATSKGQEFLNDIIARFLISFKDTGIKRLSYKPDIDDNSARIYAKIYRLREFSRQLDSLPSKKLIPHRADIFEDFTFWAIKFYAEDLIRDTGFIIYESLENWALSQFEHKERSTVRAKCRSVWNWYAERDFQIPRKHKTLKQYQEETMATRQEHLRKVNREKRERNRKVVINAITGLYADEYKKKSGAWHYQKIADATGISSKTVAKIIKEYEAKKDR